MKIIETKVPGARWQVRWYIRGKRHRKHFAKQEDAKKFARTEQSRLNAGGGVVMDATARAEWSACLSICEPLGIRPLEACREFQARRAVAGDLHRPSFADAVQMFLDQRATKGRSGRTMATLRHRLTRLMEAGCDQWTEWNRTALEKAVFNGRAARSAINDLAAARNFSRWAVRKGWLPMDPTDSIERPDSPHAEPRILTPEEVDRLLVAAGPWRGWFAVLLFAGLRPSEAAWMKWPDCIRDGEIIVSRVGKRAKTVRTVPLLPRLAAILAECPVKKPRAERRRWIIEEAGVTWQEDICRHTFVSYRLAAVKDRAQVRHEAGHSEATQQRYYSVPVTAAEAALFWAV